MPPAVVVAGLALAAALVGAVRLLLRRRGALPRPQERFEAFCDAGAGYHKEAPSWPVDDCAIEAQEEEVTCPECNAVLIYAMPLAHEGDDPRGAPEGERRMQRA